VGKLTPETAGSEDARLKATFLLVYHGFALHEKAEKKKGGRCPGPLQCVLHTLDGEHCEIRFSLAAAPPGQGALIMRGLRLDNDDLWWALPYYVSKDYEFEHSEKVFGEAGYYFLAQPGQEFYLLMLNHGDKPVGLKPKLDTRYCTDEV
jgi:hypothetical protein